MLLLEKKQGRNE